MLYPSLAVQLGTLDGTIQAMADGKSDPSYDAAITDALPYTRTF